MLQPTELRQLSQLSAWRTLLSIAGDWFLIAATFFLAASFPNPLVWLVCFVLMGRNQLGLAILMHDGAHRRLFKDQKLNDWVGQVATAAPLFFAMDSYKKLHLKHHLNPLVSDDPDLSLIGGYPIGKGSFLRKIGRDLCGVSYFKFIGYFIYRSRSSSAKRSTSPKPAQASGHPSGVSKTFVAVSILVVQSLMFGALWVTGHAWLYLTLWILPFMTILQFLLRIRGIAEHAGYQPNENQALNARTVVNPLQTFFFAPHGVHYHIEHHLYPSVPFYRLPEVHRLLKERGSLPAQNLYTGYGKIISELVR